MDSLLLYCTCTSRGKVLIPLSLSISISRFIKERRCPGEYSSLGTLIADHRLAVRVDLHCHQEEQHTPFSLGATALPTLS